MPERSPGRRRLRPSWILIALVLAIGGMVGGLALVTQGQGRTAHIDDHPMTLPVNFPAEPAWYRDASDTVKGAYLEAAYHQNDLQYIPCYCGCSEIHTSNANCYFQQDAQGEVTAFDQHASACQVCVEITHDVIDKLDQGKSLYQIRQEIDRKYEIYGPEPTPTPMPPTE